MKVKKSIYFPIISLFLVLSLAFSLIPSAFTLFSEETEPQITQPVMQTITPSFDESELENIPLQIEMTSASTAEEWDEMFEAEWRAMGLSAPPTLMPAPGGSFGSGTNAGVREFTYSLVTPAAAGRADADSVVIVLMGDGFTSSAADQAKWRYYCQYFARNVLNYKPFDEFQDAIKIYRIDVVSNSSGVTRSDSPDGRNMPGIDPKDTYFGGVLWSSGMARLGSASRSARGTNMANAYFPGNTSSSKAIIFNSEIYGGSGGSTSFATLSWAFVDLVIHEVAHTAGNHPDEYFISGTALPTNHRNNFRTSYTIVHRDHINNPDWQEWSPWFRLLGKNGTTFDPWMEGLTASADYANLLRPVSNCKMRYLGSTDILDLTGEEEFPFCEMCREQWRDRLCILSRTPVLHFQPYNDQFYDNMDVVLNNKHFIVRTPVAEANTSSRVCLKVYGEQLGGTTAVRGVIGNVRMTISKDGVPIPAYTNVPVTTPMSLAVGTYTVEASFVGTYNGTPYTLALSSVENEFEVKPQTIVTKVGKYAEPWNSADKTDTLTREWRADTPVMLPELVFDPARVGAESISQFDVTYSWHVRNFDGSRGTQISELGTYPGTPVPGPTATGQYVLAVHTKANATYTGSVAGYSVTNDYPFDISTPFRKADHYAVNGAVYSHELVSNDFRGITITGEGFTDAEQDKFEAAAEAFITKFLATDPVNRVTSRFCFFIVNSMSAGSGISKEGDQRVDTYYGFEIKEDGTIGTFRTDKPMDAIFFQEVWRRDTNQKTWAQWGTTVVLVNEEEVEATANWRHPEANRGAHVSTIADPEYKRLIESVVTQFAHVRSSRDMNLLDTYRWMEGPDQNKTFQETLERLIESCYSHEMYGSGNLNLPRPVVVSDAANKVYYTNGTAVFNWDVPATFRAYSFGHQLVTGAATANTFTYRYYTDNNHRVGTQLTSAPVAPGFYWVEADLPTGAKTFAGTHLNGTRTDRYGFTYNAGQSLPGVNGTGTANSARVRGFVRIEIAMATHTTEDYDYQLAKAQEFLTSESIYSHGDIVNLDWDLCLPDTVAAARQFLIDYLAQEHIAAPNFNLMTYETQVALAGEILAGIYEAYEFLARLVRTTPHAFVTKLNGNQNDLTIWVVQHYSDGTAIERARVTLKINNNAAATYNVGVYRVYVDTKGNDQIRDCRIVG